jgi:AcrR family transcriptional regulator
VAKKTRTPLNRERVLRAAVKLADAGGIDALSMRRLGQELGVEAMSLYNHVANKDDVLDGIVDLIAGELEPLRPELGWKAAIRELVISWHDLFLRHRWAHQIWMSRGKIGDERMRWGETMLRTLREGGISEDLTYRAFHVLQSHVIGYTAYQLSFPYSKDELTGMAKDFLRDFPVEEFPYLMEHVQQHLDERPQGRSDFEFGLDLILDGLERLNEAEATTARARSEAG